MPTLVSVYLLETCGNGNTYNLIMKNYKTLIKNTTWLERHVIAIIYVEKMTVKETAHILEVPEAAVKKILWNVTDRLMR